MRHALRCINNRHKSYYLINALTNIPYIVFSSWNLVQTPEWARVLLHLHWYRNSYVDSIPVHSTVPTFKTMNVVSDPYQICSIDLAEESQVSELLLFRYVILIYDDVTSHSCILFITLFFFSGMKLMIKVRSVHDIGLRSW